MSDFITALTGKKPTIQDLLDLRNFFPEQCFFHWNGMGTVPIGSLVVFNESESVEEACGGCNVRDCPVRMRPNPNL